MPNKIKVPAKLEDLLKESNLKNSIGNFTGKVESILKDNKLHFFPNYTDHGVDHISAVLLTEVDLIPQIVWDESEEKIHPKLLNDKDAAVILGATLLHDLAMHLQPSGFLELIGEETRFQPLPWFKDEHNEISPDLNWPQLWADYVHEMKRISVRDLSKIIGEQSAQNWKFQGLPSDQGKWEQNHVLIIGEFIRRHHARIAHEIAIYGFPGLIAGYGADEFPALIDDANLHPLADLIGLTARSHGLSLRVCKDYLDFAYPGDPRPMGSAILYPMALLRVADYFQIDNKRAPTILLKLRQPQSPDSVAEWEKHKAITNIGPGTNSRSKRITISKGLNFFVYLQIEALINSLQGELDHSSAVLDEVYGNRTDLKLNHLGLEIRRIESSLQEKSFRDALPFVTRSTGFSSDPNILTLLVKPLYEDQPAVGVRELMQNSVDSVNELEVWCKREGVSKASLELPNQEGDVEIHYVKELNKSPFLRIQDKGIGMAPETIQNYFLRAGASFRNSKEWGKVFLDENGDSMVTRSGRFGIGVFAAFLLGSNLKMWTRHVQKKGYGFFLSAMENSQLIEIQKYEGIPIGTRIEIELSQSVFDRLLSNSYRSPLLIDWYCDSNPRVIQRVFNGDKNAVLKQWFTNPDFSKEVPPSWSVIQPDGFDEVRWTFKDAPVLSCNGLIIRNPNEKYDKDGRFHWPSGIGLVSPNVSIIDSQANLPLTVQRYELSEKNLPFHDKLIRDVLLSFIAHALVKGPKKRSETFDLVKMHPLAIKEIAIKENGRFFLQSHVLRWVSSAIGYFPMDDWFLSIIENQSLVIFGMLYDEEEESKYQMPFDLVKAIGSIFQDIPCSMIRYDGILHTDLSDKNLEGDYSEIVAEIISELLTQEIGRFSYNVDISSVLVSTRTGYPNLYLNEGRLDKLKITEIESFKRERYKAILGEEPKFINSWFLLDQMEAYCGEHNKNNPKSKVDPDLLYVAQIKIEKIKALPKSTLAKVWNECLGPNILPFNSEERAKLIELGRKHLDLARHIEAWEKMK